MSVEKITDAQKEIKAKYDEIKKADLKQKAQQEVVSAAQDAQEALNKIADELKKPIVEALEKLKKITAKLNNAVDMNMTWDMVKQTTMNNAAALSSQVGDMASDQLDAMKKQFEDVFKAEDSSIVQDVAGKILNTTIKTGFDAIKAPINTIMSIIPIAPLTEQVNAITDALDGMVEIATTDIPDDQLDAMLTAKVGTDAYLQQQKEQLKGEADKLSKAAKDTYEKTKNGIKDKIGDAQDKAKEVANNVKDSTKAIAAGLGEGAKQAWKDFRCPEMPPGIEATLKDFVDAVMHVCTNIQNVAIVVLFKLIGCIFDCLNQIVGVIGVPTFPDPLGQIMKLIPDAIAIFTFISNLPISLIKLGKAIVMKKVKELSIISDPPAAIQPMKTVPEVANEGPKSCGGGGGGGGDEEEKKKYTVKFYSGEDPTKVISEQEVEEGAAASNPGEQTKTTTSKDYVWNFIGWDKDFSSVTSSMDIYPQFIDEPVVTSEQSTVNGVVMSEQQKQAYMSGFNAAIAASTNT